MELKGCTGAIAGANKTDAHVRNVNLDRDAKVAAYLDLCVARQGDRCPRCDGTLREKRGIEVGHVFKLGTKYSEALGARFLDAQEQLHPIIMGCYGIGVNRILAALIETSYDDAGIIWPVALAPYEVVVLPVNVADAPTSQAAEKLYGNLRARGVEVLLDDRDQRAGVKFKDADLIGFPLRVVVGERGLKQGKLEIKWRWDRQAELVGLDSAAEHIAGLIGEERATGARFLKR
jgi:prolyl-tRNA synthetase